MSEPIPDAAAGGGIPDLAAAAALLELIAHLHTDPLARPLVTAGFLGPMYYVGQGNIAVYLRNPAAGAEQLAAARVLFGGEVTDNGGNDGNVHKKITSQWRGVQLRVHIKIAREDELAVARKRIAELESEVALREGALIEQRHQLDDPAVPPAGWAPEAAAAAVSEVTL